MQPPTPDVIRLFPTFVWQSRLEPACYELLNRDLLVYVETLMRALVAEAAQAPLGNPGTRYSESS
jgi:hypothetical protein